MRRKTIPLPSVSPSPSPSHTSGVDDEHSESHYQSHGAHIFSHGSDQKQYQQQSISFIGQSPVHPSTLSPTFASASTSTSKGLKGSIHAPQISPDPTTATTSVDASRSTTSVDVSPSDDVDTERARDEKMLHGWTVPIPTLRLGMHTIGGYANAPVTAAPTGPATAATATATAAPTSPAADVSKLSISGVNESPGKGPKPFQNPSSGLGLGAYVQAASFQPASSRVNASISASISSGAGANAATSTVSDVTGKSIDTVSDQKHDSSSSSETLTFLPRHSHNPSSSLTLSPPTIHLSHASDPSSATGPLQLYDPSVTVLQHDPSTTKALPHDPSATPNVYINGLPPHLPESQLLALAAPFGVVRSVRTFTRHVRDCESGYGFVL